MFTFNVYDMDRNWLGAVRASGWDDADTMARERFNVQFYIRMAM